jgi:hypothetical protein
MRGDFPQKHVRLAIGQKTGGEGDVANFKHGGGGRKIRNSKFEIRKR